MKKSARQLEFISRINRNGKGVKKVDIDYEFYLTERNEVFDLYQLSLTEKTYIAIGFNSFVVKIKDKLTKN